MMQKKPYKRGGNLPKDKAGVKKKFSEEFPEFKGFFTGGPPLVRIFQLIFWVVKKQEGGF